ncbi:MAG TPA: Xaa-Pro peptidase family protein [Gemmatimonadaceae bacterium]|nr:Xaa-Pro peptidase family protein [Gemmatimonadaceae bacterium]
MLTPDTLPRLQEALAAAGLDGWLVFDFQGTNPIAGGLLGLEGMVTRRIFAWIPREGVPVAMTHAIEQGPWRRWPDAWGHERYSAWRELEGLLAEVVRGKVIAMEYSPGDAVPYLDRVPAGVLEMVKNAGATDVVSSAELVSRFYAGWTEAQLESHRRAAEAIREVAMDAFSHAAERARSGSPIAEHELQQRILDAFAARGLEADHGPIVALGANAADPHYAPSAERPVPITEGSTLLIDLWAREIDGPGVYADQTWMASLGEPSSRAQEVWSAVRDARDAAIELLRARISAGQPVRGGEADDAAREVIVDRGFGDYFTHRTGHSIDPRSLHGSGPHLDNLETREERFLLPGVGFSIEPGIYIPGDIGMRTEVNAHVGLGGSLLVTPEVYQRELIVV